jgi:recombination protein RecR
MEEKELEKLIGSFMILPGVGYKTAQRYAYKILDLDKDKVEDFARTLVNAKDKIKFCSRCGGFAEDDLCNICKSRQSKIVCVVEEAKDIASIEKVKNFDCLYHVLNGCISPLAGKGPDDIRLKELLMRVNKEDIEEIVVATNPSVEGEATAMYISKILKPLNIKVTRLAQGLSLGSDIDYADEVTLSKAIESRHEI